MITDDHTALFALLVLGAFFDVSLLFVVVAHIRYISVLYGKITALEASTDMLLQSQTELNKLLVVFVQNK